MAWIDAMAPAEDARKEKILAATWGHLAPKKKKEYSGYIIFTHTIYGDIIIINNDFKDLRDSPWLFRSMMDFIGNQKAEDGAVYRFDGMIKNYKFIGKVKKLNLE